MCNCYRITALVFIGLLCGLNGCDTAVQVPVLSALSVSGGTLTPPFAAELTAYTVQVVPWIESVQVTATANSRGSIIEVNGAEVTSGSPSPPVALAPGATMIRVMLRDGEEATKTYALIVQKSQVPSAYF